MQEIKLAQPIKSITVQPLAPIQKRDHGPSNPLAACTPDNWGDDLTNESGDLIGSPEWMILYGDFRSGKTHAYLNMLEYAHQLNGQMRSYVISTDEALKRNLQQFPYITNNGFLRPAWCRDIETVMDRTAQLVNSKGLLQPGVDWIIVDLASTMWQGMATYWAKKALGKDTDEIALDRLNSDDGKGNAMLEYYANHINPTWHRWEQSLRNSGCHVILVASEQPITEEDVRNQRTGKVIKKGDKDAVVKLYRGVGVLPAIQKSTAFQYHNIIHFSQPYVGRFFVQTVGERGERNWMSPKVEITGKSFGDVYLRDIAGWK